MALVIPAQAMNAREGVPLQAMRDSWIQLALAQLGMVSDFCLNDALQGSAPAVINHTLTLLPLSRTTRFAAKTMLDVVMPASLHRRWPNPAHPLCVPHA